MNTAFSAKYVIRVIESKDKTDYFVKHVPQNRLNLPHKQKKKTNGVDKLLNRRNRFRYPGDPLSLRVLF